MVEVSEDTHVDKANAWDRNARKNDEIKRLRSALRDVIGMLDDPTGAEHVRDMRGATVIARAALKEGE